MKKKPKRDRAGFRKHIKTLSEEKLLCLEAAMVEHVDSLNDDVDYGIELLSDIDDRLQFLEGINFDNITRTDKRKSFDEK
jgi:hypothetical protein